MIIIGHRGAKGLAPENTVASIKKAMELGVDEIEVDVRITKDGTAILNHNPAVKDRFNKAFFIIDNTYAELKKKKTDLLTFEEAVTQINRRVPLLIEVKPREPTSKIVTLIQQYLAKGWQTKDFLLGSFSQKTLLRLHEDLPEIEKVVIESWSSIRATARAKQLKTKRLNMNQRWLWGGLIRAMKRRGYELCAYTINNPTKAQRWAKHGLAGVITDYPDRFKN